MSKRKADFTAKFFYPPERTVSCHNGLLNIRNKHIIAKDRLIVAKHRILDVERQKSTINLQLLAFEQKQFEKKILSRIHSDQSLQIRKRSTSDASDRRITYSYDTLEMKSCENINHSNSNLLFPSDMDNSQRRFSSCSNEDILENDFPTNDTESTGEKKTIIQSPLIVTIIPPEEDTFVRVQ